MAKVKKPKKHDWMLLQVQYWGSFTEKGLITRKDGFCQVLLPEGFEYRFPDASTPMLIIKEDELLQIPDEVGRPK